jgi:parvulin-like peptidyl-prolyl isomerase
MRNYGGIIFSNNMQDELKEEVKVEITTEQAPKKDYRKIAISFGGGALIAILFAIIATFSVFMVGIYRFGWYNETALEFAKIVPLPVAKVGSKSVSLHEYLEVVNAVSKLYAREAESQGSAELRPLDEIREQVYLDFIDRELTKLLAVKYNVAVSNDEVNAAYTEREADIQALAEIGWSADDIKRILIGPSLLTNKVDQAIFADKTLKEDAKKRIDEVKAQLDKGGDFAELAKQFSEDGSASDGGDLGYFGRDYMVKPFENAAFALNAGEVSGVIETEFGYHIIKVEEVEKKAGRVDRVHARHILIRLADYASELEKIRTQTTISKYLKFANS